MSTFDDTARGASLSRSIGEIVVGMIALVVVLILSMRFGGLAFAFAVVFVAGWIYWSRRERAALGVGTTPVTGSIGGYTELFGTAEPSKEGPIRDPVADEQCLWFGIQTERLREAKHGERWEVVKRASSSRAFQLRDESGTCHVLPAGALFELADPQLVQAGDELRHNVWRIRAGDSVYVLGQLDSASRCISRPRNGRHFVISDRAPHLVEKELGRKADWYRFAAIIAAIVVLVIWLSGCSRRESDGQGPNRGEVGYTTRFSTAHLAAEAKKMDELLAEQDRAQRWRKELAAWKRLKGERHVAETSRQAQELQQDKDKVRELRETVTDVAYLRLQGAHAPAGTIPDMLEVMDERQQSVVGNRSNRPLRVWVTRHGRYPHRQTETFWCTTYARGAKDGEYPRPGVLLAPGTSELFLISQTHPCHHLEHSVIEFEVRDGSRLIWANDTVLERLERYAHEDLAKLEEKVPGSETEVDAALIENP